MKNYKAIFSSKIFIATLFTLIGAATAVLTYNIAKNKNEPTDIFSDFDKIIEKHHQRMFSNFDHDSIFTEMEEMEKRMDEVFKSHRKYMSEAFIRAEKNGNSIIKNTSITNYQDENNYYYELKFAGFKKEDIIVEVKDKNLTFSAKKGNNEKNSKSLMNFYYSFSIPQDANEQPEVTKEEEKIIVKFNKNKKNSIKS